VTDLFPGGSFVQLIQWGYPQGSLRPVPPAAKAYSVVHITGNSSLPSAESEVAWRKNTPSVQNSATFFVNRNGSFVQALGDPLRMDPWTNGDVSQPDTSNPRIAAMVADRVNANERTIVSIENVGYEPGNSITAAQEATDARIIAYYHAKAGVPVTRQTVIGHYQLNSTSRPNCPAVNKAVLDRIVALASPEVDMPVLLKPVREKWVTRFSADGSAGFFTTDGPGQGDKKWFTAAETVESYAETADGKYRAIAYNNGTETLWMLRTQLNPIGGTRVPATGYGLAVPDCSAQDAVIESQKQRIARATVKANETVEALR
jgi:hypothetical protein